MKYLLIGVLYITCALGPAPAFVVDIQYAGPAFPAIAMITGGVLSGASMIMQGRAQRKAMHQQAREAQHNALSQVYDANYNESVAEYNEKEAMMLAHEQRSRVRRKGRATAAGVTNQLQRQGLELGSVSFDDVLTSVAVDANTEAQQAGYEAYQKGVGFRAQKAGFRRGAGMAFTMGHSRAFSLRQAGSAAQASGFIGGAGALASGVGAGAAEWPTD